MKKRLKTLIPATLLIGLVSSVDTIAGASVWESPNSWDEKAELACSKWNKEAVSTKMFTDEKSRYYGIATDCADFSYTLRAICAFEHKLPFAIRDTTNLKGKNLISNAMTRWDSTKNSPLFKFKEFIKLLHNIGGTGTLSDDTYPVAMNRQSLLPGSMFLFTGSDAHSGHVQQIGEINRYGLPRIVESTTPQKVRELREGWHFPDHFPSESTKSPLYSDGYRRFKWPSEIWTSGLTLRKANLQQFEIAKELNGKLDAINERYEALLAVEIESLDQKANRLFSNICSSLRARAESVADSLVRQNELKGQCMGPKDFEAYSTPSRDTTIRATFQMLKVVLGKADGMNLNFFEKDHLKSIFSGNLTAANQDFLGKACILTSLRGGPPSRAYTLGDYYRLTTRNFFTWDPNASLEQRWGLADLSSLRCPDYQERVPRH